MNLSHVSCCNGQFDNAFVSNLSMNRFVKRVSSTVLCGCVSISKGHKMAKQTFKCFDCNNEYKNKSSLRRHINTAHLNKRFVCIECNKEYKRNIDFLKHRVKHHQSLIIKNSERNISYKSKPTHSI